MFFWTWVKISLLNNNVVHRATYVADADYLLSITNFIVRYMPYIIKSGSFLLLCNASEEEFATSVATAPPPPPPPPQPPKPIAVHTYVKYSYCLWVYPIVR